MNIKSLLLGSAAALVAVSGARAADAVVIAEPEPVEYVRVCDVYGAGYYYIPGTETCLRVGGYLRYDIGVGDGGYGGVDTDGDGDNDSYYKRARAALQLDARSETELGTLRAYMHINFDYDRYGDGETVIDTGLDLDGDGVIDGDDLITIDDADGTDDFVGINHAYLELGGFRAGKTDSLFSTLTGYAGGVIQDDLVPYGPFGTHQLAYTWTGGNGFTASVALEEGSGSDAINDYMPHVVAGVAFVQGWGGVSAVAGYDSQNEEWAGKVRLDVKATESVSLFVMGGYKTDDGEFEGDENDGSNYYGNWGCDDDDDCDAWAIWGGGSAVVSEKATVNVQLSYDEGENFAAVANVAYQVVPGLTITPEVAYTDSFDDDGDDDDGDFGGFLRLQRDF